MLKKKRKRSASKSVRHDLVPPERILHCDGSSTAWGGGRMGYAVVNRLGEVLTAEGVRQAAGNSSQVAEVVALTSAYMRVPLNDQRAWVIRSDSQYALNVIQKGWGKSWRRQGWKRSNGKPAANVYYVERLLEVAEGRKCVRLEWVPGHSPDPIHSLADSTSRAAAFENEHLGEVHDDEDDHK